MDVLNRDRMEQLVVENRIDWLVHLTSLLSVTGEAYPDLAIQVNVGGFQNALDVARKHKLRIFAPSSIAAFGPTTPRVNTPGSFFFDNSQKQNLTCFPKSVDLTLLFPTTIYGVTKVHLELLGTYYYNKFGVDFRSLRFQKNFVCNTDQLINAISKNQIPGNYQLRD